MNASVPMGFLAFFVLASSTSASAHSTERVRRELRAQGYDQIEFARTKFPVWVNACRGNERLHLHVDWYGKITVTDETPKGSCPTGSENENSNIASELDPGAKKILNTKAEPKDGPRNEGVGCKKFLPAIGMTVTVPCE